MENQLFDRFMRAEQFYYDQFFGFVILVLVLLFFWLIMLLYGRQREKKIVSTIVCVIVIPLSLWLSITIVEDQPMIALSSRLTASVRDYTRLPFATVSYSVAEMSAFRNRYAPNSYQDLPMYQQEELEEVVTYLDVIQTLD